MDEVYIPTMQRIDKKQKRIKLPLLNLVLVVFFTMLIICSAFVNIHFCHHYSTNFFISCNSENCIYNFSIIPQIPILMFVCSSLGKRLSTTCTLLYFFLGIIILPIFGFGGGLSYLSEYSFGYILGYIPAVVLTGSLLKNKYTIINMILGSILGVLVIHIFGIIYMLIIALINHDGYSFIKSWISIQSGIKILYDIIFSFLGILLGKIVNKLLNYVNN